MASEWLPRGVTLRLSQGVGVGPVPYLFIIFLKFAGGV